jgi:hypothetical protein
MPSRLDEITKATAIAGSLRRRPIQSPLRALLLTAAHPTA